MDQATYRFFDHTGDFGVEVVAATDAAAVAGVALAFLDLLTGAPETVAVREERSIAVAGHDPVETLVAFANELLYLFDGENFLCARFAPESIRATVICGVAHGELFDPARHPIARPVKAVTYHSAAFATDPSARPAQRFRARLIFDL